MKIWSPLKNFFFRLMVYFVILLWPIIKIKNIDNQTDALKQKLEYNFRYFGLTSFKEFTEDPSLFLLIYSLIEIVAGVMGVFGSYTGGFLSCILFVFTNFIYFNPFFEENYLSLYKTREEVFLNIGLLTSLILTTFYPYGILDKKEDDVDSEDNLNNNNKTNNKTNDTNKQQLDSNTAKSGKKKKNK